LQCEVCGNRIAGKPLKVIIEGAKLIVCAQCSKLGRICYDEPKHERLMARPRKMLAPPTAQMKKTQAAVVDTTQELVENFDVKIRQAREGFGLSHEELGRRLNEKVSLLRKIETGKMVPNNRLAKMLERALKIQLIVPTKEEKFPESHTAKTASRELTLGDLVHISKEDRKREDPTERKPS